MSGFASDKVRALLTFLALSPDRPHRREALAGLLWPEFPERSARTNLRNALANLRQVLGEQASSSGGPASPPFLHSTWQTIQFNGQSDYWLDAEAFEALVAAVPPTSEGLEEAVGLVAGLFLEGFTLADAAPFEEWQLLRREHLGREMVRALGSLAALYERSGDYEQALGHARRRVELEPWQENGQRQLMRLLARGGQRSEALAQYEKLCRSLQEELGADPLPETMALWEEILSGELAPEPALYGAPSVPSWNLPASPTPFFGRVDELAALEARLFEPDTRLVTLFGLGGSGKTRLALEAGRRLAERDRQALAAQALPTFPHGIVFVPLAAIDSVEGLVPALVDALRLRLEGGQEQLLDFLRRKQLLLILDNLEQLLDAAAFLAEILRTAPSVKMVVTSRMRLQVQGEHVITLSGLRYPDQDIGASLPQAVEVDDWVAAYPALQLLADGVRRVRSKFSLGIADLPVMLGICRLVDGLPLGLELAASWADVLPLDNILIEARESLEFLGADWPDLPARHRSIRAVFDVSWQRLSPAEQTLFSSLTVFRGGLTRVAAGEVVAGIEAIPGLLAALVRKSFLQYDRGADRFQIHKLMRLFGADKLAEEPSRELAARDRHSAHFARALKRWEADLVGSRQQAALAEMEADSENIRAAWSWAVEQAQVESMDRGMEGLFHFCWSSGRYPEGQAAFGAAAVSAAKAARSARTIADEATCLRVWVRALAWQSNFQRALGHADAARRIQQQALTALENPALGGWDTRLERAILAHCIGASAVDFEQARQRFEESFALFRDLDHQWGMAQALNGWGNMSAILGSYQDAQRRLEEGLAIWRALGNQPSVSYSLGILAYLARMEGRFEEAAILARQAYAVWLEEGARSRVGMNHQFLGTALEHLGRFSEAQAVLQEGVALVSALGNRVRYTQAHSALVRIDLHLGRYEEARDHGEIGLALSRTDGPRFCIGLNLLLLGCLDVAGGAFASALRHIQDSIAVYGEYGQTDDLSWGFAVLALAALGLGETGEARQHLLRALQIAVDVGAVPPLLWALPAAALLLADGGEHERAVELYALASRYPFVAKSRWFADVAGDTLAEVAATLPAERVVVLEERGQACDLEATAAKLLTQLSR